MVLAAIGFDNEPRFITKEINHVWSKLMLPAEFEAVKAAIS